MARGNWFLGIFITLIILLMWIGGVEIIIDRNPDWIQLPHWELVLRSTVALLLISCIFGIIPATLLKFTIMPRHSYFRLLLFIGVILGVIFSLMFAADHYLNFLSK